VLHDMFGIPFEEIAPIVDRSPAAARQLASRARRRVRGRAPEGELDVGRQHEVIDGFIAAAREGDFDALVAVLDPDVVLRADGGPDVPPGSSLELRGAETVASRALTFSRLDLLQRPALINGTAGVVSLKDGKPFSIGALTVRDGRIVELDFVSDPEVMARIDLTILDPS
jgi:RNA polymerase sigma-70 factor (ECF subfamily)